MVENKMEKTIEKQKYVFIEVLRIVACFLVIVNHTNSNIFLTTGPSITWFLSLTYFFISKMAVPIFVMISGYTMLDKQDDYKKSGKRILRSVLVLLLFSLMYYINQWMNGTRLVIGVTDYLVSVAQVPQSLAYWYMYMYIGLLIMMPFLQKFVSSLSKWDCQIFIGLSLLIYGIWPILEHIWPSLTYSKLVDLALFDSYIGLLMVGYYMKKYVTQSKKLLILSILGFVVGLGFNIVMTYKEYQINGGMNYLFYDNRVYLPIVLEGICFFYIVLHCQWKGWVAKVLKVIGGCTFGIFLLSDLFIEKLMFVYNELYEKGVHPIISVVVFEILVFLSGVVVTFILKRIPLLKKLL